MPEAQNLATNDSLVGEGSGGAKNDGRFFDGHGQALLRSVLDDRPGRSTVNVQLFPAQNCFGFTERIGVLVPPIELSDLDHADVALQLWWSGSLAIDSGSAGLRQKLRGCPLLAFGREDVLHHGGCGTVPLFESVAVNPKGKGRV
jgi:hypothetical protein